MQMRRELTRRQTLLSGAAALSAMLPITASAGMFGQFMVNGSGASPPALPGKVAVGLSIDVSLFKNWMMALTSLQAQVSGFAFPSVMNANQLPAGNLGSGQGYYGVLTPPSNVTSSTTMSFAWTGTISNGAIAFSFGAPGFTVTSGSAFVYGSTSFNIAFTGTNGYVEFNFVGTPGQLTFAFGASSTFTGLSNIILCAKSDYASIVAATTPEQLISSTYISALQALQPKALRMLGLNDVNDNNCFTLHKYRLSWQNALSFVNSPWIPTCWAGQSSGTNAYTCSSATDSPSSYTAGEPLQLQFVNASTSTPITIARGGLSAVPLFSMSGAALTSAAISAKALATLIYDDLLGGYLVNFSGYGGNGGSVPVEMQVAIANAVGCDLWYNLPPHINYTSTSLESSPSVSQIAALISSTLTYGCYFEYSDEIWNYVNGFPQSGWATKCGSTLGFPLGNNRQFAGYYGYRLAVMWPLVSAAWGAKSGLKCVNAFQAFGPPLVIGSTNVYRLQGADLASVANGGQGNSTWVSYTGNANFTAFPNRPADVSDCISYATYYCGAQCQNFDPNYSNTSGTGLTTGGPASGPGSTISGLCGAADAYAAGGSTNIANAIAWLDWDIRQGTNNGSASAGAGQTLFELKSGANSGTGIYPVWETVAASYDGSRPAGKANLTVDCYEGAMECHAPSTGECTTLGISTSYGGAAGTIQNLINGYKNSSTFAATVTQQFNDFFVGAHSATASWFQVTPTSQWSMYPGDIYTTPYQSYAAVEAYD